MAPCGPARRQEQGGLRRSTGSAAALGLAAGLCLVWKMVEGPRRARIHNLQRGCITRALLSLFVGASSTTEGLECQARRRRTQSNRWSRRGPSPVWNSGIEESAVR